jgi:hypothetical protein
MNTTDAILGLILIITLAWIALIQLNVADLTNNVGIIALQQTKQNILFSPKDICENVDGHVLVEEENLSTEEYLVIPGKTAEQKIFCIYKKTS